MVRPAYTPAPVARMIGGFPRRLPRLAALILASAHSWAPVAPSCCSGRSHDPRKLAGEWILPAIRRDDPARAPARGPTVALGPRGTVVLLWP